MIRYRRYKAVIIVLCMAGVCILLLSIANHRYRENNRAKYEKKIEFYQECLEQEKSWIAAQQTVEGAIFLYAEEESECSTVVPYFSCTAAMGMLAGDPDEKDLLCVSRYLSWHAEELIESGGIISDYVIIQGEMKPTGTYDSVDSYIAAYLSLLAVYAQKGGDLDCIPNAEESVQICINRLKQLTNRNLTKVSDDKDIYYLMDNLEVLEAYEKMDALMKSGNQAVENWENKEADTEYFSQIKEQSKNAIETTFWNEAEQRFEVGVDGDFSYLEFQGMEEFYPYAIAQVYCVACDVEMKEKETIQNLYAQLSDHYEWVTLEQNTTFEWPVLSYIAVKLEDTQAAEEYMRNYRNKYGTERTYPFKVTDAAWAAKTYAELYDYYQQKANRNLWDLLWER